MIKPIFANNADSEEGSKGEMLSLYNEEKEQSLSQLTDNIRYFI